MNAKKKLKRYFNLVLQSSKASFEDQFIGPVLSPFMTRDKIKVFCEEFNNKSKIIKASLKLMVKLYLYDDKTFFFIIKGVSFSLLVKLLLNLNFHEFNNAIKTITIFEMYDLIYFKNIFLVKFLSYDNILF
jgi:ribosomal protein L11